MLNQCGRSANVAVLSHCYSGRHPANADLLMQPLRRVKRGEASEYEPVCLPARLANGEADGPLACREWQHMTLACLAARPASEMSGE